jgi:type IV fimbrial biogenesis protein FimT
MSIPTDPSRARLPPAPPTRRRLEGITLIELLITVAIAVILLTLGIAGFTRLIAENRMAAAVNGFVTSLQTARSEAVKRGVDVTVCVSTDGDDSSCENAPDAWGGRYVVIASSGEADEEVLRVQSGMPAITVAGEAASFVYAPDGTTETADGTDELHFSDPGGSANCRTVRVSPVGHVSTEKEASSTCPAFEE